VLYVVGFAAFWISESVIVILLYLNCKQTKPDADFFPLVTLFNLLRLTQCFFIYFVIFKSENVRRAFKKFLKKMFTNNSKSHDLKKMDSLSQETSTNPNEEIFNFESLLLDIQEQNNNIDILKISQVVTIVSGIYVAYKEYYNIKGDYFNHIIPEISSSNAL
jgi:cytochrome b subunit of formate dehydrogenase